jgi:hypothetical protein
LLVTENAVNVEGASESSAQIHPSASTMANATTTTTTTSTSTEEYVYTFPPTGDESEELVPPKVEDFARPCLNNIHHFVFNSIVAHNMNKATANAMHHKSDSFEELAKNISTTMMIFAEQVSQLFYMYNLCTDPPVRLFPTDLPPKSAPPPPPRAPQQHERTESKKEDAANSDLMVPSLLLVILTLSAYIGYLSYKMKTK